MSLLKFWQTFKDIFNVAGLWYVINGVFTIPVFFFILKGLIYSICALISITALKKAIEMFS